MRTLPESDWKQYRKLLSVALDRYCERTLAEIRDASIKPGQTNHERYLSVYRIARERDMEMERIFSNQSRSNAIFGLGMIRKEKLLPDEEFQSFSEETRAGIDGTA